MTLPSDIARCAGYGADECRTCRRYTDPPHERQTWTGPWELEGVPCEMRIPTQSPDEMPSLRRVDASARDSRPQGTYHQAL